MSIRGSSMARSPSRGPRTHGTYLIEIGVSDFLAVSMVFRNQWRVPPFLDWKIHVYLHRLGGANSTFCELDLWGVHRASRWETFDIPGSWLRAWSSVKRQENGAPERRTFSNPVVTPLLDSHGSFLVSSLFLHTSFSRCSDLNQH